MKKFICFLIILINPLMAQVSLNQDNQDVVEREGQKYKTSLEKFYKNRSILRNVSPQILEDELEADSYLVGPGDEFSLNFFGEINEELRFSVLPEGNVVIPTVGAVNINGMNLKNAGETISAAIRKYYNDSDFSINIVGLRKFRVYLTGEVKTPGTYFVQGSDRVSDVIEIASGLTDWADETSVEIRHMGGTIDTLNISKYYRDADKDQNLFMHGGDVIHIPAINLSDPYVIVESRIEKIVGSKIDENSSYTEKRSTRKIYRLMDEETVTMFLRRISAFTAEIDLSTITLVREGNSKIINLLNGYEEYEGFLLKNKDILNIPDLNREVYVQGEVRIPGAYVFNVNLRANDYIGKAGVLERAKNSDDVIIIRAGTKEVFKGGDTIIEKGDTIIVPRKRRELVKDYVSIIIPVLSIVISTIAIVTR